MRSVASCGRSNLAKVREIGSRAVRRLYISAAEEQLIVAEFRKRYLGSGVAFGWMGELASTSPLDLWIYQEIMHELKVDVVVAVATKSAGYLAAICQMSKQGEVLSFDPALGAPAGQMSAVARERTRARRSVMVVIGSGCGDDRLPEDLVAYGELVTSGGYLIVEDTDPDISPHRSNSRAQNVDAFLERNRNFVADRAREKFYLTLNPGGFLRRR